MADVIEAVLQNDMPGLRAAFDLLVTPDAPLLSNIAMEVRSALLDEVCIALAADDETMSECVCGLLGLAAASPYSEGVAKVARIRAALQRGAGSQN